MAISFIESATASAGNDATSLVLNLTNAQEGDFALVWFYSDSWEGTYWEPATPSGMTAVGTPFPVLTLITREIYTQAFRGVIGAGQTSITIDKAAGTNRSHTAAVMVFRGVDATSPLSATPTHGDYRNDTTPTAPAITFADNDAAVVSFVCYSHNDLTGWSPPAGQTLAASLIDGFTRVVGAAYELGVAAGTYPAADWTAVGDATGRAESHTATFALKPAVEAATPVALVQTKRYVQLNDANGEASVTLDVAPTPGNILVASCLARRDVYSDPVPVWTDATVQTGASSWQLIDQEYTATSDTEGAHRGALWWRVVGASDGSTVTINTGAPNTDIFFEVFEFSHDFTTPALSAAGSTNLDMSGVLSASVSTGATGAAESAPVLWVSLATIRNGFNTSSVDWSPTVNEAGHYVMSGAFHGEFAWGESATTDSQNWTATAADAFTSHRFALLYGFVEGGAAPVAHTQTVTDGVGVLDSSTAASTKLLTVADSIGVADAASPARIQHVDVVDTTGLLDTAVPARLLNVAATDSIGGLDPPQISSAQNVAAADGVGAADAASLATSMSVVRNDLVGAVDEAQRAGASPLTATDLSGLSDVSTVQHARVRSDTITDGSGIVDTATVARHLSLVFNDIVGVTDTPATASTTSVTISDGVGLVDVAAASGGAAATFTEQLGLADLATAPAALYVTADESVGASDSTTTAHPQSLDVTDALGLLDSADIAEVGGAALADSFSNALGVTDAFATAQSHYLVATDGVGLVDHAAPAKVTSVTFAEAMGVADASVVNLLRTLTQEVVDQLASLDTQQSSTSGVTVVSDELGTSDTAATSRTIVLSFTESIGLTDQYVESLSAGLDESIAELVGLADVVSSALTSPRAFTDTAELSDAAVVSVGRGVERADVVGATDTFVVSLAKIVAIADSLGAIDTASQAQAAQQVVADALGASDLAAVYEAASESHTQTDLAAIADTVTVSIAKSLTVADALDATDSVTAAAAKVVQATEILSLLDTEIPSMAYSTQLTDALAGLDAMELSSQMTAVISEALTLGDTAQASKAMVQSLLDRIAALDTALPVMSLALVIVDALGATEECVVYSPTGTGFFHMGSIAKLYVGNVPVKYLYYGDVLVWSAPVQV